MTDDVVEVKLRFRRRTARVVGVVGGVVVLLVAWWAVSAQGTVEAGSSGWSPGHQDECTYPDETMWALYAVDEQVVAARTVRNPSPWSVEVISTRPEAYRFMALADDPRDDVAMPATGEPLPPTTDRVTIPPGREVAMVITDPFPADGTMTREMERDSARTGLDGVDVEIRSLGLPHDARIELGGFLWQSELAADSPTFQRELAEMCH